ncbi:uncharacterized protein Z520_07133 [Fonsecaea multimorphosa CBS 102226]|uniref:Transcription factor domain-containing protein n=1 Tax=Fonsecaea multimorphosa CBS 102226 TaxID=1442371 RepID=A0A0D2K1Y2_9EURO|nr:uncharacterized protein Z520_07133 [Fonsecaea multimorphosa CBS 102226]KIX97019.1 hypothetical protein Z520_07133 [Fonsecaea multimorphosa CBS 102226]OAL22798.1 hypothetical protein AYO22_06706 [Fonsecaea multimorphosa]
MAGNAPAGRFMFVEYSKPVEPVKGEKRRRGGPSEVRAHITKNYHRALRVKRLEALRKGQDGGGPVEKSKLEPRDGPARETSEGETQDGDVAIEEHEEKEDGDEFSPHKPYPTPPVDDDREDLALQLRSARGLQSLLGEGRIDPFDALPVQGVPLFIHQVLDHALSHSWPNTVPVKSSLHTMNPVKSAWLKCGMEHPVAFHAFVYAASYHILCAYNGREINESAPLLRLSHKVETIKLVNEQLRSLSLSSPTKRKGRDYNTTSRESGNGGRAINTTTVPTDALIMAVTIMSVHNTRDETEYPKVHPLSPMAKVNNLHVYGAMVNDEKHIQGILLLISQKGGLGGIELYGMADTMQLCDLYFASKYACRPNFPWNRPIRSLVSTGKHILDPVAIDLDSKLGAGFRYLRQSPAGQQLLEVLDAYSEVTVALDHHVRGGPTAPELAELSEARNCAQHRLLSQMPCPLDLSSPELCVHHAVRLGALIFSEMVIFPLPPPQGVKPRLALMLQQTLEACDLLGCWDLHGQVLLWSLTLGTIASSFTPQRAWYIEQLLQQILLLQIQDSSILALICSRFLWWKPVCNEPLRWLWDEIFPPSTIEAT